MRLQLRDIVEKNSQRAFAFLGDAFGDQFIHQRFEPRIVKAFAECLVKFYTEPRVNFVELLFRQRNHFTPDFQVFRVAALEFDEFLAGGLPDGFHGFARGDDHFIKPLHFADGIGFERVRFQVVFPAEQQHPELRAPVADVVVGDDAVAEQPQRARQAIAENRRADMPDVHRLGHVRRTEINHHGSRLRGLVKKQVFAARGGLERLRERGMLQPEIQEARAGDFNLLADFSNIQSCQNIGCELTRIQLSRLGQRHQRITLVIAKFRVGTRTDENRREVRLRQNGADGMLQTEFDLFVREHAVR